MRKKRMVIQSVSGEPEIDHSYRYTFKKGLWLAEVVIVEDEGEGGDVLETIKLSPDTKVTLVQMMDVITQVINEHVDEDQRALGYRVYCLK